jgi:hypothetical protein
MVGSFLRLAAAAVFFSCTLAACASTPDYDSSYAPSRAGSGDAADWCRGAPRRHCNALPYARNHSGINIFGDASTWWDKSEGQYAHRQTPLPGAVMMLTGYAGPNPRPPRGRSRDGVDIAKSASITPTGSTTARSTPTTRSWTSARTMTGAKCGCGISARSPGHRTYLVRGFIGPGRGRRARRQQRSGFDQLGNCWPARASRK